MAEEDEFLGFSGAAPEAYDLRVTTIFRRENGQWKIAHKPRPGGGYRALAATAQPATGR